MPWWIWLLLVLFMLAMLIIGGIYAFIHGMRALNSVSATAAQVGERFLRLGEQSGERDGNSDQGESEAPLFTQPLNVSLDRYERAHIAVIERAQAKRVRHATTWARWKH